MKHIRRSLLVLCFAALLASLLGTGAKATSGTFSYVDENGDSQYRSCTYVESSSGNLTIQNAGWYAVYGDVNIGGTLTFACTGDVNLILCDDATLTVGTALYGNNATVNIYGQKNGAGKLIAGSINFNSSAVSVKSLTVCGGVLQAASGDGDSSQRGIDVSESLTVLGGSVTASGFYGIHGNSGSASIAVSGGSVTVNGVLAGIEAGSITVSGGTVDVTASSLGGQANGLFAVTELTITGGKVSAKREEGATGGYGAFCNGGDITLAWNDPDASVIFSSVGSDVVIKTQFTADGGPAREAARFQFGWDSGTVNGELANKTLRPYVVHYNLTVAEGIEHGTVTASTATPFAGQTVTLTVKPDDGYRLDTLTVTQGETPVEVTPVDATHYTFTMPAGNVTVSAVFEKIPTFSVTVAEGIEHGTVTANVAQAQEGQTVTLTVTPTEGCRLDTLTVMQGGGNVAVTEVDATHYTFTMPDGDVTVTAEFITIPTHFITISARTAQLEEGGATVTALLGDNPVTSAYEGATVTLVLGLMDDSYAYSCNSSAPTVKQGTTPVSVTRVDATHYTFTMPKGDVDVTAEFQISGYVISQGDGTSGAKLTYTVNVFSNTASLTVADAWGGYGVTIPDTVRYDNKDLPVTTLSVSSNALSRIATLTGGENVTTIYGNLYSWQKETTRNFNSEGYYSLSGLSSVVVPDTKAALAAIPAFIRGHYDADGAYYVGKCPSAWTRAIRARSR
jgi:hypothetical protein